MTSELTNNDTNRGIGNHYKNNVIGAGDDLSDVLKAVCAVANKRTSVYKYLNDDGVTLASGLESEDVIDGVGSKVEIYAAVFESYFEDFQGGKMNEDEVIEKASILWTRMFSDLLAMNADDLRDGKMAICMMDIIEVNHVGLEDDKKKVFKNSVAKAVERTIDDNDIMITAGESAITGQGRVANSIISTTEELIGTLERMELGEDPDIKRRVSELLVSHKVHIDKMKNQIEFKGVGGTAKGVMTPNTKKLVDLKEGQWIVGLQEISEDGIIGPRSNGITAIREHMKDLAGDEWEIMKFEDYITHIGPEKAGLLSSELMNVCKGKQLWEIATGKTTVFNPFVAREALGGIEGSPVVDISAIIHVTGNPLRKVSEALPGLGMDIDISQMPIPQIMEIIQTGKGLSAKEMIEDCGLNMGLPQVEVCNTKEDVERFIELAKNRKDRDGNPKPIVGRILGRTLAQDEGQIIRGVGVENSEIKLEEAA